MALAEVKYAAGKFAEAGAAVRAAIDAFEAKGNVVSIPRAAVFLGECPRHG